MDSICRVSRDELEHDRKQVDADPKDIDLMYENMLAAFADNNGDNQAFNEFLCNTLEEKHNREAAARLICTVLGLLDKRSIISAAEAFQHQLVGDLRQDLENKGEWFNEDWTPANLIQELESSEPDQ